MRILLAHEKVSNIATLPPTHKTSLLLSQFKKTSYAFTICAYILVVRLKRKKSKNESINKIKIAWHNYYTATKDITYFPIRTKSKVNNVKQRRIPNIMSYLEN